MICWARYFPAFASVNSQLVAVDGRYVSDSRGQPALAGLLLVFHVKRKAPSRKASEAGFPVSYPTFHFAVK
jgi:hypothetical protein